jgi:Ca2+-binding EF-hand superfamily protein
MAPTRAETKSRRSLRNTAKVFLSIDKDGSGNIDLDELVSAGKFVS